MKFYVLTLFFCLCSSAFSQTYYYVQKYKVDIRTKNKTIGDNTGQFITFTKQVCYDSDKQGNTVNNGTLSFDGQNGNVLVYSGNSYWGDSKYIVAQNKERINIKPSAGKFIYVYVKSTPTSQTTCSLIKGQSDDAPFIPNMNNPLTDNLNASTNDVDANSLISHYRNLESKVESAIRSYENSFNSDASSGVARSGMVSSIISMQRQMSDWRSYAQRQGITIPQSYWETQRPSPNTYHIKAK